MAILWSVRDANGSRTPFGHSRNHSEDYRSRIEEFMGKVEEERETNQHAKDRIDEYVDKQREEHIDHRQEGGSALVDAMAIEHQTVLEHKMFTTLRYYRANRLRRGADPRLHHQKLHGQMWNSRTMTRQWLSPMMIERSWNLKMLMRKDQMPDSRLRNEIPQYADSLGKLTEKTHQ